YMLKRQMFGRAHLDLLNRRFLLVPRHERAPTPHAAAAVAARPLPAAVHPLHQKSPRTKQATVHSPLPPVGSGASAARALSSTHHSPPPGGGVHDRWVVVS